MVSTVDKRRKIRSLVAYRAYSTCLIDNSRADLLTREFRREPDTLSYTLKQKIGALIQGIFLNDIP